MAVTANLLTSGTVDAATGATTASISPTAGNFVIIILGNYRAGANAQNPTITGAGTTWNRQLSQASADTFSAIHLFYAFAAGTGALTIAMSDVSHTNLKWSVIEFPGANLTSAIQQQVSNLAAATNTGITVTLSAFANSNNATYGAVYDRASRARTIGSGFSAVSNNSTTATLVDEFNAGNDTTVDWTWDSAAVNVVAIAVEIIAAAVVAGTTHGYKSLLGVGV